MSEAPASDSDNAQKISIKSSTSSYLSVSPFFLRICFGVLLFFSNFVYAFAEQDVQESKKHNNNDKSIANHTHEYAQNMNLEPNAEEDADCLLSSVPSLSRRASFQRQDTSDITKVGGKLAAAAATCSLYAPFPQQEFRYHTKIVSEACIINKCRYCFKSRRFSHNCILVCRSSSLVFLFKITHKVEGPMLSRFSASPRAVSEALEMSSRKESSNKKAPRK